MAAKQLMLPANRAFNSNGLAVPGAVARLYASGTSTPANFYFDAGLTTSMGSFITANGQGRFTPLPYQSETTAFRLKVEDASGVQLDDIDPYYFGTTLSGSITIAAGASYSSRTLLAAVTGAVANQVAILTESGREGTFVWLSSNLSAKVTADTAQGIYVAPAAVSTGASGAWVRKFDGPMNAGWFGLIEGDSSANSGANTAAMAACLATAAARKSSTGSNNDGMERIAVPGGVFWFADNGAGAGIDIITDVILEGHAPGYITGAAPVLKFVANISGIRVQNDQSSGALVKDAVAHSDATGTLIRNLALRGSFTTTEGEYHGIVLRATATIENVGVRDFQGDGVHVWATVTAADGADPPYGNANAAKLDRVSVRGCRDGISFNGTDANACTIILPNINSCRRWGIYESSSIGNSYFGGQFATNAIVAANDGVSIGASVVSYSGQRYYAIAGQEAGASTNAPSGTAADNTWWAWMSAGGVTSGIPAWTSGILVRAGGCIRTDDIGSFNGLSDIYVEHNHGKAQCVQGTTIRGGMLAGWVLQNDTANLGCTVMSSGTSGALNVKPSVKVISGGTTIDLGATAGNTSNFLLRGTHASFGANPATLSLVNSAVDVRFGYNAASATTFFEAKGPNTADQFGTGAAFPYALWVPNLMVSDNSKSIANGRRIMVDNAVPATQAHAGGEFIFNRTNTKGVNFGWRCYAAGTPGSWEALYSGFGLGAIGYDTGAGGAVTQATSRTTGVTLNKICGAITLFSAAGSATWQTFTVTNSAVTTTDTVIVSQKSGTDLNMIFVTNVSAGSFKISFATTGGTTTEQPVFNFAIIKAVAA